MQLLRGNNSIVAAGKTEKNSGRIRELDGWRALGAICVLGEHVLFYQHERSLSHFRELEWIVHSSGYLGVQMFFVLSGFLICRLLLLEEQRYGAFSLRNFYCRRICRIIPPLYLYLAVMLILSSLGWIRLTLREIRSAGLFLYDFHSWWRPWLVGHTWSLSVEEQFYLIFPVALMITPRRWRVAVCAAVFGLCILWAVSAGATAGQALIAGGVRAGFACISCGVLIALLEAPCRSVARRVPAVLVILAGCMLALHPVGSDNWIAELYESAAAPLALALILLFSMERGVWLRSFLCWKPVQAVGLTSYGLYIWQQLFSGAPPNYLGPGRMIPFLLPLLGIIVPASYFFLEEPSRRLGKRLSRRKRDTAKTVTAVA